MPSPENLPKHSEGFVITDIAEDPNNPRVKELAINKIVYQGIAHLYKGVDWLEVDIDPPIGTVYFVSFCAAEERELKPYGDLTPSEKLERDELQDHLTRNINE